MAEEGPYIIGEGDEDLAKLRQREGERQTLEGIKPKGKETTTRDEGDVDQATGGPNKRFREGTGRG